MHILLLIVLFFAGLMGRRLGWLTPRHGAFMLKLVMSVGLPALFIASINRLALTSEMLWLPGICIAIMVVICGVATLVGARLALSRQRLGAFVICTMAINVGFEFPFVIAAWGETAFAQLALFDLGNTIVQCTLMYALAARYGGHGSSLGSLLQRMAGYPPLWALLLALGLNFSGVLLPEPLLEVLSSGGRIVLLLVVVALGVLFDAKQVSSPAILAAVGLRVVGGLLLALLFVSLLGLEGEIRAVILLGASAPIGFSVVVIANRESLDREFAASAASLSVLMGLLYVPLMLLLN